MKVRSPLGIASCRISFCDASACVREVAAAIMCCVVCAEGQHGFCLGKSCDQEGQGGPSLGGFCQALAVSGCQSAQHCGRCAQRIIPCVCLHSFTQHRLGRQHALELEQFPAAPGSSNTLAVCDEHTGSSAASPWDAGSVPGLWSPTFVCELDWCDTQVRLASPCCLAHCSINTWWLLCEVNLLLCPWLWMIMMISFEMESVCTALVHSSGDEKNFFTERHVFAGHDSRLRLLVVSRWSQ